MSRHTAEQPQHDHDFIGEIACLCIIRRHYDKFDTSECLHPREPFSGLRGLIDADTTDMARQHSGLQSKIVSLQFCCL